MLMHWQQIIQDVQTKAFKLDFKIYNQSWQGQHAPQRFPKGTKQRKENTYLCNFFAFSYLHGLHEMIVLLHFNFNRGHEGRLKMKRKKIQTQTQTQKKWKSFPYWKMAVDGQLRPLRQWPRLAWWARTPGRINHLGSIPWLWICRISTLCRIVSSKCWFYLNLTSKELDRHNQIWTLDLRDPRLIRWRLGLYFDAWSPFYTDQVFRH